MTALIRLPNTLARRGKSRTQHYNDIVQGLFTAPIKVGIRAVAWPDYEIDELVRATIRGDSEEQVKALVKRLHSARANR